jgi:putative heme-binding domain-containing protein
VAVERQDPQDWHERAFAEKRATAIIQAMLAVSRTGTKEQQAAVLKKLNSLAFERLTEEQFLDALRVYQLAYIRLGGRQPENAETDTAVIERLGPLFPHQSEFVSRELCQVLVYLEAPGIVERAMQALKAGQTQQDQMFFAFVLRNARAGWTPELRREYFSWLNLAEFKYRGGASFQKFIQQIRRDAADKLTPTELQSLADVIENRNNVEVVKLETTRQFIHNWQMSDLAERLDEVERGRSFANGRAAFEAAQCFKCHRFKGEGGDTGPDLTGVGGRFKPDYLLEALILPSKVISDQYQNTTVETEDGEIFAGRVIDENEERLLIRPDPFARQPVEVKKSSITTRAPSPLSEMPVGLINVLTPEEILDLIAYMRSGGDPQDKAFGQ